MKRSSNISLVAMATLAFTASFAGGSAFLGWNPGQRSQTCTKGPDGVETCTPARGSGGYGRYFGYSLFSGGSADTSGAKPAAFSSGAASPGTPPAAGTARGGFGASARAASAHGSAAG